jgi:hypothetical protein
LDSLFKKTEAAEVASQEADEQLEKLQADRAAKVSYILLCHVVPDRLTIISGSRFATHQKRT